MLEEILIYENRDQLYQFLIDDFDFIKAAEKYDPVNFGNWAVELADKDITLTYYNDRSFLDINIAKKDERTDGYSLSFVQDFIYNPENINSDEITENVIRIKTLNNFLKRDFLKIKNLFNSENYIDTQQKINYLLKEKFFKRFPSQNNH
ncbi:MAG: hypothetical protein M3R17_03705 [Bacteroidota bacterium]|nr:hypothetical protein [Bacteroidota bacterium]